MILVLVEVVRSIRIATEKKLKLFFIDIFEASLLRDWLFYFLSQSLIPLFSFIGVALVYYLSLLSFNEADIEDWFI